MMRNNYANTDSINRDKISPMMLHYLEIKDEYQDAILMYRLGDFYEMFFDDALLASEVLELTLTGRNCGLDERAPMCGVPHHAVESYIVRLVNAGYKVAICEQLESAAEARGLVSRDVTRVYTPGTLDIANPSTSDDNIYIASAYINGNDIGLAIADISTGELIVTKYEDDDNLTSLTNEISTKGIREIIIDERVEERVKLAFSTHMINAYIDTLDASYFKKDTCQEMVLSHFGQTSLIPLDLDERPQMVIAIGALLAYLIDTQKGRPSQLIKLTIRSKNDYMQLDKQTMRNLELLETIYDHSVRGSLLGVLDKTKTAMGGRLLKQWLREPLRDASLIRHRLDSVQELINNPIIANNISNSLRQIYDFERLSAAIASGKANARDMIALRNSLAELPEIKSLLADFNNELLGKINDELSNFDELFNLIDIAICEAPPHSITEGGIIRNGYSRELDTLKSSIADAKNWIASLEYSEKERTGIKTLKVGYNKVFGYYIDVSKTMSERVPDDYIRKQTLVNNERYITPELKEKEGLVLSAEAKINKLEYDEFCKIRQDASKYIKPLQDASHAIATLDILISFANVAANNSYVKPNVDDSDIIEIKGGRHPAVEQLLGAGVFISNDTYLNLTDRTELIITGPNMSGKSTYMRQTAIIVLMAQIGSFVPADLANIGIVDRIFTRIGASDNLSYGQSTFYIEMSELAGILRNATSRSLILLDEIGRGTSTYDGLSIAWATASYLADSNNRARTMFATHYHELTKLAYEFDGIHNLSVAVADDGNDIVFLHNIVEGPASKSYGIHVARIAGVPEEIQNNAKAKLQELESKEIHKSENIQISFIEHLTNEENSLVDRLTSININHMTPLNALNTLQSLIDEAHEIKSKGDYAND